MTDGDPPTVDELARAWRDQGARITPERRDLLEVLRTAPEPLTANDMVVALRRRHGRAVDLSTAHRGLRGLQSCGLVDRVAVGGGRGKVSSAYRLHRAQEFTALCQTCDSVVALPVAALRWARTIEKASGFRIGPGSPALLGHCAACTAAPHPAVGNPSPEAARPARTGLTGSAAPRSPGPAAFDGPTPRSPGPQAPAAPT
jgi:Fe2+ or Zn2+ uptake regulation protein